MVRLAHDTTNTLSLSLSSFVVRACPLVQIEQNKKKTREYSTRLGFFSVLDYLYIINIHISCQKIVQFFIKIYTYEIHLVDMA